MNSYVCEKLLPLPLALIAVGVVEEPLLQHLGCRLNARALEVAPQLQRGMAHTVARRSDQADLTRLVVT